MDEISALIARSQAGESDAREVLIEKNLGLVHHIVKRFAGRGYDTEDLFQIGCIGLMKAIDKFDLEQGVKFSTYAVPMIMGEIKRFLRDDGLVKVSRTIKENAYKVKTARQALQMEQGREPTFQEVAARTELSREDVMLATEASMPVESIYASVSLQDGSEIYLLDRIVTSGSDNNREENLLNHMLLEQLMQELDEREEELIRLRYFREKTQAQVATVLGISQVQVSRLEKKILMRLRQKATN
ncbi:MAG: SigF/SigG family RNA polymerase sporulation sigma factor [Lachnospiraceae bacterium]|nr:SigF/SigG family RNA polymerase sporulation sigma factor [Lachnospiraceae bacterium]